MNSKSNSRLGFLLAAACGKQSSLLHALFLSNQRRRFATARPDQDLFSFPALPTSNNAFPSLSRIFSTFLFSGRRAFCGYAAEQFSDDEYECDYDNHKASSSVANIDEWNWKLNLLLHNEKDQEIVSRDKRDRRDYEQISNLAKRMGLYCELYGKVVVASKVPLPNYRPDLDDKRPQREVVIPLSLQRRVEGLLQEHLDRMQLSSERVSGTSVDTKATDQVEDVNPDDDPDSFLDGSVMEKVLQRQSLRMRNMQRTWQESPEGRTMLDFRRSLPAFKEKERLLQAIAQNQVCELYGKVVVASKVPLPNYRPDLDDKRPQREVVIPLSLQRRVEGLLQEHLDRMQLSSERVSGTSVDTKATDQVEDVNPDDDPDSFLDGSVMEKVLQRQSLRMRNMQRTWQLLLINIVIMDSAPAQVQNAVDFLKMIGALDENENLTHLGGFLSMLPVDPKLGKMLIMGAIFSCFDPILTIVAGLSVRDPFLLPQDKKDFNSDSFLCLIVDRLQFLYSSQSYWECDFTEILDQDSQKLIFEKPPPNVRKIVLATNMAEASITINDVVFVIDCGKAKETTYDALNNTPCLLPSWISQASARQRRGRAGRVQPGECYHLYPQCVYEAFAEYQLPELLRTPLNSLCLQIKSLQVGSIGDFLSAALQPPESLAVQNAVDFLKMIGALDENENLTHLGGFLSMLPVDPKLGKMLIMGAIFSCFDPILTIVAGLSVRDPFLLPQDKKDLAGTAKSRFSAKDYSDHMALVRAYEGWKDAERGGSAYEYCWRNFLSAQTLQAIHSLRKQFSFILKGAGLLDADAGTNNRLSHNQSLVRAIICSGLFPGIASVVHRETSMSFKTMDDGQVLLYANSVNARYQTIPYPWLVFGEKVKVNTVFIRDSTGVSDSILILFGGNLNHGVLVISFIAKCFLCLVLNEITLEGTSPVQINLASFNHHLQPHPLLEFLNAQQKLHDGPFGEVLKSAQEAIVLPPWVALAIRLRPGVWEYIRVNINALVVEELSVPEYLHFKEELVEGPRNGNFLGDNGIAMLQLQDPSLDIQKAGKYLMLAVQELVSGDQCEGRFVFGRESKKPKESSDSDRFTRDGTNPKSLLQTLMMRAGHSPPKYKTKHLKTNEFRALVEFKGMQFVGKPKKNKQLAERDAALEALAWLTQTSDKTNDEDDNSPPDVTDNMLKLLGKRRRSKRRSG
ncbi:DExH-box ATP-dependent RNA helicase DExH3-like [Camellia sinensis]|uniref:DExH-box ATP-dependent RNA helicase DExH3-like n=1 Tax=Camellia sinensis TaxID=4442 RepID=UPI001036B5AB|nr:DExH-box ATP-dependent RNA helicase DExH3-like [Camellia sinensis]